MEDKRIHSLMNNNWDKMLAILDNEMPVNGKKKRKFLVWWTSAAASVLIFAYFFFLGLNQKVSSNDNQGNHIKADLLNSNTNNNKTEDIKETVQSSVTQEETSINPKMEYFSATNKNSIGIKPDLAYIVAKTSECFIYTHEENNIVTPGFIVKNDSSCVRNGERYLADISSLGGKLQAIQHDTKIYLKDVNCINSNNKWRFGIDANQLTHNYKKIFSSSFGIVLDKTINDKWKLTSGLRWSRIYYSSTFLSRNDVLIVSKEDRNISSELVDNSIIVELEEKETSLLRQTLINNVTKDLDYAELSLGAAYSVNKRLYLASSFLAGYKIGSNYKESQSADKLVQNYSKDNISQTKLNDIGSLHKNFILNLRVGADFCLYKELFMSANAHIFTGKRSALSELSVPVTAIAGPENNPQLNSIENDFQIGMEIGMKYYFN